MMDKLLEVSMLAFMISATLVFLALAAAIIKEII